MEKHLARLFQRKRKQVASVKLFPTQPVELTKAWARELAADNTLAVEGVVI